MADDSNLRTIYEETGREHRFILNWRYGIIVGQLTISGLLFSKLLESTNNSCWISLGGFIISVILFLFHRRTSILLWKSKNFGAELEEKMGLDLDLGDKGVYSSNKGTATEINDSFGGVFRGLFGNIDHTGMVTWTIVLSGLAFLRILISECSYSCCYYCCW